MDALSDWRAEYPWLDLPTDLTPTQLATWRAAFTQGHDCARSLGYMEQNPYALTEVLYGAWYCGFSSYTPDPNELCWHAEFFNWRVVLPELRQLWLNTLRRST